MSPGITVFPDTSITSASAGQSLDDAGRIASISFPRTTTVPVLTEVAVWYSRAHPGDYDNSQLYHCDWDDLSQIKVFVYATEVDEASGPLTILDAQTSEMVRNKLKYLYGGKRYRVSDEEMEQFTGGYHGERVMGPAGLVAIADTSRCFHYGSRVQEESKPRIAAMFQYVSPFSIVFSPDWGESRPLKHLATSSMTPLQRLTLGA